MDECLVPHHEFVGPERQRQERGPLLRLEPLTCGSGDLSRGGLPDHGRGGQADHVIVGDGVGDDRVGSVSAAGRPS